jgi:hypothetical protein
MADSLGRVQRAYNVSLLCRRGVTQPASRGVEVGCGGMGSCVCSTRCRCRCRCRCYVDKVGPTQIRSDQIS